MLFRKKTNSGFTLVELLVTISIFVILTGVVLFNQAKFNSTILLTNLAYDTALTIRQAQTYGINIREFNTEFVPYGVHFDTSAGTSFILFADIKYNKADKKVSPYDGDTSFCNSTDGCVNRYNIKRGNYISSIEVEDSTSTSSVDILDILFQRPNPDAKIYGKDIDEDGYREYTGASIILMGADGASVRKVRVQQNGLIEILNI